MSYSNLKAVLAKKGISYKNYSDILGISEKSITNKLNGVTEFTLPEVNKTMTLCPEYSMQYLFATEQQKKQA